jgi:hypothetical protein
VRRLGGQLGRYLVAQGFLQILRRRDGARRAQRERRQQ